MSKPQYAIALCRVSTPEQRQNGSLNRQEKNVMKEAGELGVGVLRWWSGDMSSKAGTNVKRTDLKEMQDFCKQNKNVKYLIVDEPDRFMRSIDEAFYFEVLFRELGVTVWYACDANLNTGDLNAKMLKFSKYFPAEGSNVERIKKSIDGQTDALKEGRYTFHPKPGYKRGYEKGIPEIHEVRGPALRRALIRIATKQVTPTQGLIELNKSDYAKTRAPLKMDKFRKIATDPFNAGIVEINKQVQVRNENGLHTPLISKEQHLELVRIMDDKKKTQSGPRKNGNPDFPLSNLVSCGLCTDKTNGRYVGFKHSNGKNAALVYEKYRCRGCNRYVPKKDLHEQIEKHFQDNPISSEGLRELLKALDIVWKQQEGQIEQEANRITHKIKSINEAISYQVEAATDPEHTSIKDEILAAIAKKKTEVTNLEDELEKLSKEAESDKEQFLKFAFGFVENMGSNFLAISKEDRLRCKQIVFPTGFYLNAKNKVYTPEISSLYRLAENKKDLPKLEKSLLVRAKRL